MVKLIGKNKIFCAVFISWRGSNLKSIYKYSRKYSSKINLKLVVSNKSNVEGVKFARKKKIITKIDKFKNKRESEKKILEILVKKKN